MAGGDFSSTNGKFPLQWSFNNFQAHFDIDLLFESSETSKTFPNLRDTSATFNADKKIRIELTIFRKHCQSSKQEEKRGNFTFDFEKLSELFREASTDLYEWKFM